MAKPFKIRTVTSFVTIDPSDFNDGGIEQKIGRCSSLLRDMESLLTNEGFDVQTVRIATNPFGEWLLPTNDEELSANDMTTATSRLHLLNALLGKYDINFCSLGPSMKVEHTATICPLIVSFSPGRFSCSANIKACDVKSAIAAAKCVKLISSREHMEAHANDLAILGTGTHLDGGLGNFRFCTSSYVRCGIPFFPAAKAPSLGEGGDDIIKFAIGLENGAFAGVLLKEAKSIANVQRVFSGKWRSALLPIQTISEEYVNSKQGTEPIEYLGIDTSLNPSLDHGGSVARAVEQLDEVRGNFGQGSLSAAAAVTTALQSIADIKITGYCGLMLPVLEDKRLSELGMMTSSTSRIDVQKLLCISSVCGVGVDTVPISGDVSDENLSSLMLDVAALAGRWNKQLSCRVFPVPAGKAGEMTAFDSPYMCNSFVFELE
jgi:uncharacterized protein (UPF0210 family)